MKRIDQLQERDVKQEAPETNTDDFLRRYLASNFPETVSHPSSQQKSMAVESQNPQDSLKYMQKPRQGIKYDNPGGF